jgi:hypothetical protein
MELRVYTTKTKSRNILERLIEMNNFFVSLFVIVSTLVSVPCVAQNNFSEVYAGGVSYSFNAHPSIAGTGMFAKSVNDYGTYAFTAIDAVPQTLKPFTVTNNMSYGIAQKIATINGIPIWSPLAAGFSWNGQNFGWSYNSGGCATIRVKGNWLVMPCARFTKSSVSNGSGFQPIFGAYIGWGK